jgi:hypothetical protein
MDERLKNNRLSLNEAVRRADLAKDNAQRDKEKADAKKAEAADADKHFELTLADVDKPQLKLIEKKSIAQAESKTDASKPDAGQTPSDDTNPMDAKLAGSDDEDANAPQPSADAIKRETLNILSDLIDLSRSPRTVGR